MIREEKMERIATKSPIVSACENIITVPDLSAVDLTALTKKNCSLTYLDSDYPSWDFYKDLDGKPISGRGKIFEVLTWKPKKSVTSEEVRQYFCGRGFSGHSGAFTAWVGERKISGYQASIPDENSCWRDPESGLCAPFSIFYGVHRDLRFVVIDHEWGRDLSFIAFREL